MTAFNEKYGLDPCTQPGEQYAILVESLYRAETDGLHSRLI